MRSILMMKMRKVQKLTVCKVYDAQDFKIEDEITEVEISEDSPRIVEEMRLSALWITTLRVVDKIEKLWSFWCKSSVRVICITNVILFLCVNYLRLISRCVIFSGLFLGLLPLCPQDCVYPTK